MSKDKKIMDSTQTVAGVTVPSTHDGAIEALRSKGYDTAAIISFSKAARSWTEKGSLEWALWASIEVTMAEGTQ